jgi:hypothetical protein
VAQVYLRHWQNSTAGDISKWQSPLTQNQVLASDSQNMLAD